MIRKSIAILLFVCAPLAAQQQSTSAQQTTPPPAQPATSAQQVPPPLAPPDASIPDMFWRALELGNGVYVDGKIVYDDLKKRREQLAHEQYPPMTILGCSDSRVPPELIFNQSLGALFIVRSAGNVVDTFGLASIEYALLPHPPKNEKWTSLIVVLAHEDCGAVRAALSPKDPPTESLVALVERIRESLYGIAWDPDSKDALRQATIANAKSSAAYLVSHSPLIRSHVANGGVKIIVAYYSTATGKVTRVQ